MNKELLLKTISMNGLLLKPDFPAVITDFEMAGSSNGWPGRQDGLFYRTYSRHEVSYPKDSSWHVSGDNMTWGYALTLNQTSDYEISKNRLFLDDSEYFMYTTHLENSTFVSKRVGVDEKFIFPAHDRTFAESQLPHEPFGGVQSLQIYELAPVFKYGEDEFVILGELDKFVSMSSVRFTAIILEENGLQVKLNGAVDEVVNFSWANLASGEVFTVQEKMKEEHGTIKITINQMYSSNTLLTLELLILTIMIIL